MKNNSVGSQRIARLFDAGTFVELGAYRKRPDGAATGAVCGYGAVNGRLVYAFSQDSDRQKGAFDILQAEKIADLYSLALKNGAPVVGIFDSAGAYVADGASALSAFGKFLASVSRASGAIPQIALIGGTCAGLAATAAAMFDLTVLIDGKSQLFVNAPFVVGKEVGTAEFVRAKGLSSVTVAEENEAFAALRTILDLLPASAEEGVTAADSADDVNRAVSSADVAELADTGSLLEIGAGYADEMRVYLARMGGVPCGVVANNGAITAEGAKKTARFVGFCDSFGLPIVTLTDSVGVAVSSAEEGSPLAAALGKLAMTYANATAAKITAVIGKAYGAAFTLMGSKALGADVVYALPTAEISAMAPEAAVAFLWNDQITETTTRETLVSRWKAECASPEAAAADGSIDDVIDPSELRQRICAAVYMLLEKSNGEPARLHSNLPL
ncbi:MAG: hypothetical protein E7680_03185 [Ruminococcaceae bacterium]|nr:hypothetical protein [Oscillospiraceae bacterium]